MKEIYKKIITLFSASYCFFPNKERNLLEFAEKTEKVSIQANTDKNSNQTKNITQNKNLKMFLDELNKTEIYLLVTTSKQEKSNKPILLLLQTEDRLNSEQSLVNDRHLKLLFSTSDDKYNLQVPGKISINEIVRANKFPGLAKTFRSGKSYYINNLGGYKSICPVFFDKASAEDFLIETSKEALVFLTKTLPLDSDKQILQSLSNTKIISVGFGDFIEYYSQEKNKKHLEKVEFLFVPCLQKEKPASKDFDKEIDQQVNKKNFKKYQQQYYQLQAKEK